MKRIKILKYSKRIKFDEVSRVFLILWIILERFQLRRILISIVLRRNLVFGFLSDNFMQISCFSFSSGPALKGGSVLNIHLHTHSDLAIFNETEFNKSTRNEMCSKVYAYEDASYDLLAIMPVLCVKAILSSIKKKT